MLARATIHASSAQKELRICTHKTCQRSRSSHILKFAQSLQLAEIKLTECGCLGHCGSGPNVAVLPKGVILTHIDSPVRVTHVLAEYFDVHVNEADVDAATGNEAARDGRLDQAIELYTKAISLQPAHGMHLLLANRSGARLTKHDTQGAVDDAYAALEMAPVTFSTAVVRLVDSLYACHRYDEALQVLEQSPHATHPDFAHSSDCAILRRALEAAVGGKHTGGKRGRDVDPQQEKERDASSGWLRWGG